MMAMKLLKIGLPEKMEAEIEYLSKKYNVSYARVIFTGYKLCNRKDLENLLSLGN